MTTVVARRDLHGGRLPLAERRRRRRRDDGRLVHELISGRRTAGGVQGDSCRVMRRRLRLCQSWRAIDSSLLASLLGARRLPSSSRRSIS